MQIAAALGIRARPQPPGRALAERGPGQERPGRERLVGGCLQLPAEGAVAQPGPQLDPFEVRLERVRVGGPADHVLERGAHAAQGRDLAGASGSAAACRPFLARVEVGELVGLLAVDDGGRVQQVQQHFRDYTTNRLMYPAVQEFFRSTQVPLLTVWGEHDEIFGPAGATAFAKDLPDARISLLDGDHFLLESHLDEVGADRAVLDGAAVVEGADDQRGGKAFGEGGRELFPPGIHSRVPP